MEDINNVFVDADNPDINYGELGFDEQLKYTQNIKGRVLHKLISTGSGMPTDKDSVELLLKVADSMDKTTIAKRRLVIEEKTSDDAVSVLNAIVKTMGNGNPFLKQNPTDNNENTIGELPDYSDKHAEGEGEIGVITENCDAFKQRMEAINKQHIADKEKELGLV